MKILVVGQGGREHAIVWKLSQSKKDLTLYCAPGNAGIASIAKCVPIKATDIDQMVLFAHEEKIELVFVAPDDPLALGMVNAMQKANIRVFGPTKEAAIIEASKSFSKALMKKYNIPTAGYEVFTDMQEALSYIETIPVPIVIKADGLALGKGVIIAMTLEEAKDAIHKMMGDEAFGLAGKTVVIEEFLVGKELTVLAYTDGDTVVPMLNSRDHKRALDNDQGLNTGGMGAICPGELLSENDKKSMMDNIFVPTIKAMQTEGREFSGVIYFGLIFTKDGAKVIEYNARFGDPETQAVLPLLETDFLDIIEAVIDKRLDKIEIKWKDSFSCCVVIASGGYPGSYETGYEIDGLDNVTCNIFHAGTKFLSENPSQIATNGGRVLGITGIADNLESAINKAYENVNKIKFKNMHFRKDIGKTS